MKIEQRGLLCELRAKGRRLEGYAATFGMVADIGGVFQETIAPGAFANSIRTKADILALVDHDPTRVLGRTRSGTLALAEDAKGLHFDISVPDTQTGRDLLALAERGDIGGMSFGFHVVDDVRDGDHRELRAVDLLEISVVLAWPAYEGTVVNARARSYMTANLAHAARTLKILELAR